MKFIEDSFWNFLSLIVPSIASVIITSLIGRALPVGDFGIYSYLMRIINMVTFPLISLAMFCFSFGFQKDERERPKLLSSLLLVLTVLSSGLFLATVPFASIIAPVDLTSLSIFIIGLGLFVPYVIKGALTEALNGLFEFRGRFLVELARAASLLVIIGLLWAKRQLNLSSLFLAIYGALFFSILAGIYLLRSYLQFQSAFQAAERWQVFKRVWALARFFLIATILNSFLAFWVMFLLGRYWGSESLGIFSYSYFISFVISTVASAFANTLLPYSAKSDSRGIGDYLWAATFTLVYLILPLVFIIALFPNVLMGILFGRTVIGSSEHVALVALALAYLLKAIAGNFGTVLNGLGYTRDTLKIATITTIEQFTLGTWLVLHFSVEGAAWALLIVHFLQLMLSYRYISKAGVPKQFYTPAKLARLVIQRL